MQLFKVEVGEVQKTGTLAVLTSSKTFTKSTSEWQDYRGKQVQHFKCESASGKLHKNFHI